jgi:hypothetical protein
MVAFRLAIVILAAISCSMTGCLAIYSKRPVEVIATDAATGQPVAQLPVSVSYAGMLILNNPKKEEGVTDENGRLLLRMADFESGAIDLRAGDYGRTINPEIVRKGGIVETAIRETQTATPKVILRLTPQHRSFAVRWKSFVDRLYSYDGSGVPKRTVADDVLPGGTYESLHPPICVIRPSAVDGKQLPPAPENALAPFASNEFNAWTISPRIDMTPKAADEANPGK